MCSLCTFDRMKSGQPHRQRGKWLWEYVTVYWKACPEQWSHCNNGLNCGQYLLSNSLRWLSNWQRFSETFTDACTAIVNVMKLSKKKRLVLHILKGVLNNSISWVYRCSSMFSLSLSLPLSISVCFYLPTSVSIFSVSVSVYLSLYIYICERYLYAW